MKEFKLLVVSDTHCGSMLGCTPPDEQPKSMPWLKTLWDLLAEKAKAIGEVDALVANGDLIDGPGYKDTTAHLCTDVLTQAEWAAQTIALFKARSRFIVRGTGYHVDTGGSMENVVAKSIGCEVYDEGRFSINGTQVHCRHVVGRSDIPYGQYTQLGKEMINDVLQGELEDHESADLLIRSHVHYHVGAWRWNTARGKRQEVFTNPCLELRAPVQSSYVRKLRTWMYHVGFTLVTFAADGTWTIRPIIFPIKTYSPQAREVLCLT